MKIFLAPGPLEFVAMNVLGPLKRSALETTFSLVITDWLTEMTRCIVIGSTTAGEDSAALLKVVILRV